MGRAEEGKRKQKRTAESQPVRNEGETEFSGNTTSMAVGVVI